MLENKVGPGVAHLECEGSGVMEVGQMIACVGMPERIGRPLCELCRFSRLAQQFAEIERCDGTGCLPVRFQPVFEIRKDRDQTALGGFRLLRGHLDQAVGEVDFRPIQAGNLGGAESGKGADGEIGDEIGRRGVEQPGEFFDGQNSDGAGNYFRATGGRDRVRRREPALVTVGEEGSQVPPVGVAGDRADVEADEPPLDVARGKVLGRAIRVGLLEATESPSLWCDDGSRWMGKELERVSGG